MSDVSEVVRDTYEASIVSDNYETGIASEYYEATVVDLDNISTIDDDVYYASISGNGEMYVGRYRVTPTRSEQVLATRGLTMVDDVVVEAIPNNYGLIERIGMSLRVS